MGGDLTITSKGSKTGTIITLSVPADTLIQDQQVRKANISQIGSETTQKQAKNTFSDWSQFAR